MNSFNRFSIVTIPNLPSHSSGDTSILVSCCEKVKDIFIFRSGVHIKPNRVAYKLDKTQDIAWPYGGSACPFCCFSILWAQPWSNTSRFKELALMGGMLKHWISVLQQITPVDYFAVQSVNNPPKKPTKHNNSKTKENK